MSSEIRLGDYYEHVPTGFCVRVLQHAPRGGVLIELPLGGQVRVPREHLARRPAGEEARE